MIEGICGPRAMKNVVLATTMWSNVRKDDGDTREIELKKGLWEEILKSGSDPMRFEDNFESAWKIVDSIELDNTTGTEMEDEMARMKFQDTGAAKAAKNSSWNWASFKRRFMR